MEKEKEQSGKMSYFTLMLTDYMADEHPDKIVDTEFIETRSQEATERFTEASKEGKSVMQAYEEAMAVLFRGLLFSPYKMTRDIIASLLPETGSQEQHDLALQMMERMRNAIQSCHVENSGTLDTDAEDRLRKFMEGEIMSYLVENSLI